MQTPSQARPSQPAPLLKSQPPIKQTLPTWNVPPALLEVIDDVLFNVLRPAFCDVCKAGGVHTFGLTYKDVSTNTRYCLECLETACEPLPEGPEDAGIVRMAAEYLACRDQRKAA